MDGFDMYLSSLAHHFLLLQVNDANMTGVPGIGFRTCDRLVQILYEVTVMPPGGSESFLQESAKTMKKSLF